MPQKKSNDKIWADLNTRLLTAMQQNDWHEMKMVYYEQALLLHKESRDSFRFIQESIQSELYQYQGESNIKRVEVLAPGDACLACKSLNGKVFTIIQVLAQPPVPVADCVNKSCRCSYIPYGLGKTEVSQIPW